MNLHQLIVDPQKDRKGSLKDHQSEEDLILVMSERKVTTEDLEVEAEIDMNKELNIMILIL